MLKIIAIIALAASLSACTATINENGKHYKRHDFPNPHHRYDYYNEHEHRYNGYPYDKMRGKHCSPGHVKKDWC